LDRWCSDFGSPELEGLVDRAFSENLDMRQAWARLEQMEAVQGQVRSSMFPVVTADAAVGGNRASTFELAPDPNGGPPSVRQTAANSMSYRASLGAAYEVDVWGRLSQQRKAAAYDVEATRADVEAIAISITSAVAEAWFDVVAQQEKRELLLVQIELAQKYLDLTKLRLSQGVATAIDVNQQDQQLESLRGQLVRVEALQSIAANRLAVLLGKAPTDGPLVGTSALPAMPPLPAAGAPGQLLERRPDVRAAMLRLQSADARTAAAARDKLPTLRLSASTFLQATDLANLVDDVFWSITGLLSQTLWNGGRKDAAEAQAEAAAKGLLYAYAKVVIQALADVQNAVVLETSQTQFLVHLEAQREKGQIALELARERYRSGSLDYLRVLTSLQSVQQLEQGLVDARRQQFSHRISLCRALGGSWTQELSDPGMDEGASQ
jgi:NodT family efflux transporter outer membrane factor (OMF) lipoprotein